MSGHTPGPWRVNEDGDICADGSGASDNLIFETVHWDTGYAHDQACNANARLAAAAPDLKAACKEMDDMINGGIFITNYGHEDRAGEAMRNLYAAIANAEGRTL